MNISAVNCTPIKPQTFGNIISDEYQKLCKLEDFSDGVIDEFVASEQQDKKTNIKKPLAAAASVGLAGLLAFASGRLAANKIAEVLKSAHVDLPGVMDNSLRKVSGKMKDTASKLLSENPATKSAKAKNVLSKVISTTENVAKKGYKKIAYSRVLAEDTAEVIKSKAFANMGGALGVATILPTVCSKDNDENGVADILQIGQNAYTGTKTKMSDMLNNVGKLSDLVSILT